MGVSPVYGLFPVAGSSPSPTVETDAYEPGSFRGVTRSSPVSDGLHKLIVI